MRTPSRSAGIAVLAATVACGTPSAPVAGADGGSVGYGSGGTTSAGGAGSGGSGGSSGAGGAGQGGTAGTGTGGGGGTAGGAVGLGGAVFAGAGGGDTITTAPWPESCVPPAFLSRPASEYLLSGPAGDDQSGQPAGPGESMMATLNGFARSFIRFDTNAAGLVGYGFDGSIRISLPTLAPGTNSCPAAAIEYRNLAAGTRDSNSAGSVNCCTIQIIRSGAVGEPIEGIFSGILVHQSLQSWIKVEDGHFTVLRRGVGGAGGTGQGGTGG